MNRIVIGTGEMEVRQVGRLLLLLHVGAAIWIAEASSAFPSSRLHATTNRAAAQATGVTFTVFCYAFEAKRKRTRGKRRSSRPVVEAVVVQCLSLPAHGNSSSSNLSPWVKRRLRWSQSELLFPFLGTLAAVDSCHETNEPTRKVQYQHDRVVHLEKKKLLLLLLFSSILAVVAGEGGRRSLAWGKGVLKLTDRLSLLAFPFAPFLHSPIHRFVGSSK